MRFQHITLALALLNATIAFYAITLGIQDNLIFWIALISLITAGCALWVGGWLDLPEEVR